MSNILEPNFRAVRISKNQNIKDIVKGITRAINESKEASKILAEKFYDKDKVKSCEKVWHYLKKNLQYIREGKDEQTSKTLPRLIFDKYGDCKHYTIFSYAILQELGIPVFMRLVSQKILNKEPTHIYTYAIINGKEYIVDPVMNDFNQECKYNYKCDLTLNKAMSMTHLSGLNDAELGRKKRGGGLFSKAKDKASKVKEAVKKEDKKRKEKFKAVKKKHDEFLKKQGKKIETGVKKRFAHIKKDVAVKVFLNSVAKNYLNLATRIKAVYKTHPEDLKKFWANFGAWQDLTTAVNKGTKIGAYMSGEEDGGGDQAKQYEEGAKQSMGIIMQIIEFFKKRKAEKNAKQDAEDSQAISNMEASVMADPTIPKVDENGNPVKADEEKGENAQESDSGKPQEDLPFLQTTTGKVTLGLGVAGVLYFATKK